MKDNNNYEKINYFSIISTLVVFLALIIIYFSVIIHYIIQNFRKDLTILWIDYFITVLIGIIFTIIYLITLLLNTENRINKYKELYSNILYILSNSSLLLLFYTIANNSIFDIIKSINISYKLFKFIGIKDKDPSAIFDKFKEIDLMNIITPNKHIISIIIMNIINFMLVAIFILIYTNINILDNLISIKNYNIYLFQYYHLIILITLIINFLIINFMKNFLLKRQYHINNKFAMNIYNILLNQIIYYVDILFFKIFIDLFVNISLILKVFSLFSSFSIIFLEFSLFIFVFIGGSILLAIDKNNNNQKSKTHLNKIKTTDILNLLFNHEDIHFPENGFNIFMNEYDYYSNCSEDEILILSRLEINYIENNFKLHFDNMEYNLNEIKEIDSESKEDEDSNVDNNSVIDNSDFNTIAEYYIIYKLLFLFFYKNQNLYRNFSDKVKKNKNIIFRQPSLETILSVKESDKKGSKILKEEENKIKREEFTLNASPLTDLGKLESNKLISFLAIKKKDFSKNIQEVEILEEINKKYKKEKKSKFSFTIKALSHKNLFEIFPFYQLKIEDILNSLNPLNNLQIFQNILDNINKNLNNESEKNSNNGSSKKSKNGSDKNSNNVSRKNTNNEFEKNSNNESIKNSYNENTENNEKNNNENNKKNENNESEKNSNNESIKNIYNEKNEINGNNKNYKKNENNENNDMKINLNDEIKKGKDNTYNESDSENKSSESIESKCYDTFNKILMVEIYNNNQDFINSEQISEFTSLYKEFSINNIKNSRYTFLPLIIGIFNIKFLGKNKIIVVYRNPLLFAKSYHFGNWINIMISDTFEKVKKSEKENVLLNINEIEIKNYITQINDFDYEEIKRTLDNDYLFLTKLNFQVFPIFHIFIGVLWNDNQKKNNESFNIGSYGSQHQCSLSVILNSSSEGYYSFNNSIKKKDTFNGDYNSLLEKEFENINDNKDIYTMKIYSSNIFRYRKIAPDDIFNSKIYEIYMKPKLLSYFKEKKKENAKRNNSQASIKSYQNEQIIIKSSDS